VKTKVVIVEDDLNIAFMLEDSLEAEGFDPVHIKEDKNLMDNILLAKPDILLLDIELGHNINGFDVGRQFRTFNKKTPIVFTTGRTQYKDLQEGYSIGNVDYVKKPYSVRELILRINELISRKKLYDNEKAFLSIGNFVFFPDEQLLKWEEEGTSLTKNENTALSLLAKNKGCVLSKEELAAAIWNEIDAKMREHQLNNLIYSLRLKLERDTNISIVTIPKKGYKLSF
jgi:DNA-binding response OmpR family regulator